MPCPHCGSKTRHKSSCPRYRRNAAKDSGRPFRLSLEEARVWYHRFGHDATLISPTGRFLFYFLLEEVERLRKKAGEA